MKKQVHFQLQSDGASVSIVYRIYPIYPSKIVVCDEKLKQIKQKYEDGQYKYEGGSRDGYIGAIRRGLNDNKSIIKIELNNLRKKKFKNLAKPFVIN